MDAKRLAEIREHYKAPRSLGFGFTDYHSDVGDLLNALEDEQLRVAVLEAQLRAIYWQLRDSESGNSCVVKAREIAEKYLIPGAKSAEECTCPEVKLRSGEKAKCDWCKRKDRERKHDTKP